MNSRVDNLVLSKYNSQQLTQSQLNQQNNQQKQNILQFNNISGINQQQNTLISNLYQKPQQNQFQSTNQIEQEIINGFNKDLPPEYIQRVVVVGDDNVKQQQGFSALNFGNNVNSATNTTNNNTGVFKFNLQPTQPTQAAQQPALQPLVPSQGTQPTQPTTQSTQVPLSLNQSVTQQGTSAQQQVTQQVTQQPTTTKLNTQINFNKNTKTQFQSPQNQLKTQFNRFIEQNLILINQSEFSQIFDKRSENHKILQKKLDLSCGADIYVSKALL